MKRLTKRALVCFALLSSLGAAAPALAQEVLPFRQVYTGNFRGQLLVIGNSVVTCDRDEENAATCNAVETGAGVPTLSNDEVETTWIDVDDDDTTFDSSRATLQMTGQVERARLYWWGSRDANGAKPPLRNGNPRQVLLRAPGAAAYTTVTASEADFVDNDPYLAFADVTALISGGGVYTVANVVTNRGDDDHFGGWALVVVNRDATQPLRHISLYDGFQPYGGTTPMVTAGFANFLTPLDGTIDADVTFIALDTDAGKTDSLSFARQDLVPVPLSNALNPATDTGNSTISAAGQFVTGREPAFPNTLGSDIDSYPVGSFLQNGDREASATFVGVPEETNFAVFIGFQTRIYSPDVSVKLTVADVDGGGVKPGDLLEYTAIITNAAEALDGAVKLVFSDFIPENTTFVPGSVQLLTTPAGGPATGALTEQADADVAVVVDDNGKPKLIVNLGQGATNMDGGALFKGQSTSLKFRVQIASNLQSNTVISNQALVTFQGQTLAVSTDSAIFEVTSSGDEPGPTDITVQGPDADNDGLTDAIETAIGSDPNDADSDDDGLIDGLEPQYDQDSDGDGLINVLDPDSDDDGIFDGTEAGKDCESPATNKAAGRCIADADPTTTTNPINADTDAGGKRDGAEDGNRNGKIDAGETDPNNPADDNDAVDTDGDGLSDKQEEELGSNPNDADSDDDGLLDGQEPNPGDDNDGDGLINILDPDSDDDGIFDGTEAGKDCANAGTNVGAGRCVADADAATTTNPINADTDGGGKRDGAEDANRNGKIDAGETDPNNPADDSTVTDTDGDGLSDKEEEDIGSNPNDADSDDDGLPDGQEPNPSDDGDGDGLPNVLDPDSDDDGILDGTEAGKDCENPATNKAAGRCVADADPTTTTSPVDPDTDAGGKRDGAEDANHNGKIDAGETDPNNPADDNTATDTDGDGLSDKEEDELGSDKNDADSDDDGLLDGDEANPSLDSDGDGLINVLDPDSDNDGLFDGTEAGKNCDDAATDKSKGSCIADADSATTTSPILPDTDGGSARDGAEDANRNGKIDPMERNPNDPTDDVMVVDRDGDGLSDEQEAVLGSNPNDRDSDDDGLIDGQEPNPGHDTDGDGLINVLDPDSDNDGLFDGTEAGKNCDGAGTDKNANRCIADADPTTTTSPLLPDTDAGGVKDGAEDPNRNGRIDAMERNPNDPADDATPPADTDMDGLSDEQEMVLGSNPMDADSDDDGVIDGQEPNPGDDGDRDGKINVLDPDSDNDGLFDGTELGKNCENPATDKSKNTCVPDADQGATTTSPVNPDTDRGGVSDGQEDQNMNGAREGAETDPNDPRDDMALAVDSDMDGLSDDMERILGSDPNDADTDNDGVIDGEEQNPGANPDGDGLINVLDPDSDNDGIADGTELGKDCSHPDTNLAAMACIPDADPGNKTNPEWHDSDNGGVPDGVEDANKNGRIDEGETDPNDPSDDRKDMMPPPVVAPQDGFVAGGGFDCAAGGGDAGRSGTVMLSLLLLAAVVLGRRRR